MLNLTRPRAIARAAAVLSASLGVAFVASVSAAEPAAAQGTRPCAEYSYCFYQHHEYDGWQLQYQATNFGDFNSPPYTTRTGVRDQVSSIINNTGRKICVYNNRVLRNPEVLTVRPYQDYISLVNVGWNDKADYWRLVGANQGCPTR